MCVNAFVAKPARGGEADRSLYDWVAAARETPQVEVLTPASWTSEEHVDRFVAALRAITARFG